MARIVTYECEECGTEVVVTESGETSLRPIYCCGLEITEVSSVPNPRVSGKKTAGKTAKKPAGRVKKVAGKSTARTTRTAKKTAGKSTGRTTKATKTAARKSAKK